MTVFYWVIGYLLVVSLNFFVIKWHLAIEEMKEDDFKVATFLMWIPFLNALGLLAVLGLVATAYVNKMIANRKKTQPFRERLFNVEKKDGRYKKKKVM